MTNYLLPVGMFAAGWAWGLFVQWIQVRRAERRYERAE